jgi:hypothetical protein
MMSNTYGFDFLRQEHLEKKDPQDDSDVPALPEENVLEEDEDTPMHDRSDLEKQFEVVQFLKKHRSSGCLLPSVIYSATGVDLSEDISVVKLLLNNSVIKVEEIPDPENPTLTIYTFGYQAKFHNVKNKTGLLAQINREKNGIRQEHLMDSYDGVEDDIQDMITSGEIIAIFNEEKKDRVLFPRGESFIVELDGHVTIDNQLLTAMSADPELSQKVHTVKTDVNPTIQIRRGEAIWVGGQWFRVSSAVREGSLKDQPKEAQAPDSVSMNKDLSKKNELEGYRRKFNEIALPLDNYLSQDAIANLATAQEAQKELQRIASAQGRTVTGGAGSQLLSSNATAKNLEALAEEFATSRGMRRRVAGAAPNTLDAKKKAEAIETAKKAASNPALIYCHARRHGCTKDIRDLYLATRHEIPKPEQELELHKRMIKEKLIENEPLKRPKMSKDNANLDEDGRPKKRRYYERKGQRITNVHLENTELGRLLAAAAEKQAMGKSVGDGGM